MRLWLLIPLVGLLATACASAQAKGSSDQPALNVPAAPPHQIELPAEPLEPVGDIPESVPTPPVRPGRAAPREPAPKPEAPKGTESKPDTAPSPAPVNPEPAPALPPAPAPQLNTPQTANTDAAARAVRTTIEHAWTTLKGVNYAPLSNERKKAYNDAKLFLTQAEDALKEGNIVFAQANATKGETLARELAGK